MDANKKLKYLKGNCNLKEQSIQNVETIKMLEHALAVLDLLRTKRERLGVNEIAKTCGLNPSTTFRILKTLEKSGWVFQFSDGRYITGQKISFVTEKNNLYLALREVAQLVMEQYTAKYGQAMNLLVREGVQCTILQQSRTKNLVDYVPPLFSTLPIYACAGGKILLSEVPVNLAEQVISFCEMKPLTSYTITDPEQYWQALRATAKQGYAFDNKESSENGSCIAVPIRDHEGTIIAALSFSGFIGIEDPQELLKYLPALQEASEKISHSLYNCWEW
jgi:DNA-binding IclR family transcriptional regulator